MTVFVLTYNLRLIGVFESPEKAMEQVRAVYRLDAEFVPAPGGSQWYYGDWSITELPVL